MSILKKLTYIFILFISSVLLAACGGVFQKVEFSKDELIYFGAERNGKLATVTDFAKVPKNTILHFELNLKNREFKDLLINDVTYNNLGVHIAENKFQIKVDKDLKIKLVFSGFFSVKLPKEIEAVGYVGKPTPPTGVDLNKVEADSTLLFKVKIKPKAPFMVQFGQHDRRYYESNQTGFFRANPDDLDTSLFEYKINVDLEVKVFYDEKEVNFKISTSPYLEFKTQHSDLNKVPYGEEVVVSLKEQYRAFLKEFKVNGVPTQFESNFEYSFKIDKDITLEVTLKGFKTYRLNYDRNLFNLTQNYTTLDLPEGADVTLTLKEPNANYKYEILVNGTAYPDTSVNFKMNKDTEVKVKETSTEQIENLDPVVKHRHRPIHTTVELNLKDRQRQINTKYTSQAVIDSLEVKNNEFAFKEPGVYRVYYNETKNGKTTITQYVYSVSYTIEKFNLNAQVYKYDEKKERSKTFKDFDKKYTKEVGMNNEYIPELSANIRKARFSDVENKFITTIETLFGIDQLLFKKIIPTFVLKNSENNTLLKQSQYEINAGKITFKDPALKDKKIVVEATISGISKQANNTTKTNLYTDREEITLKEGHNAYTDLELRMYVRGARKYANVFLQRNIKVEDLPGQFEKIPPKPNFAAPEGDLLLEKNRKGAQNLEAGVDANGDPIESKVAEVGSIYWRYAHFQRGQQNYRSLNLNGNYFQIDASNIARYYTIDFAEFGFPDHTYGIFSFSTTADVTNTLRNIEIAGNAGVSGPVLHLDSSKSVPAYFGGIHGVVASKSKLTFANSVLRNHGYGFRQLEATASYFFNSKIENNFLDGVHYMNDGGHYETNNTPESEMNEVKALSPELQRLALYKSFVYMQDSYIGINGAPGFLLQDMRRTTKLDYSANEFENRELALFNTTRSIESIKPGDFVPEFEGADWIKKTFYFNSDPNVYLKNTELNTLTPLNNDFFKIFNIQQLKTFIQSILNELQANSNQANGRNFEFLIEKDGAKYLKTPFLLLTGRIDFPEAIPEPGKPLPKTYHHCHRRETFDITFDFEYREKNSLGVYGEPKNKVINTIRPRYKCPDLPSGKEDCSYYYKSPAVSEFFSGRFLMPSSIDNREDPIGNLEELLKEPGSKKDLIQKALKRLVYDAVVSVAKKQNFDTFINISIPVKGLNPRVPQGELGASLIFGFNFK